MFAATCTRVTFSDPEPTFHHELRKYATSGGFSLSVKWLLADICCCCCCCLCCCFRQRTRHWQRRRIGRLLAHNRRHLGSISDRAAHWRGRSNLSGSRSGVVNAAVILYSETNVCNAVDGETCDVDSTTWSAAFGTSSLGPPPFLCLSVYLSVSPSLCA